MKTWEENVRKVVPYVPGEQPKVQNLIAFSASATFGDGGYGFSLVFNLIRFCTFGCSPGT